jgi:hypothetical protein
MNTRHMLCILFLILLVACGPATTQPTPTSAPAATAVVLVDELFTEAPLSSVVVFGYLYADEAGVVLTSRMSLSSEQPTYLTSPEQQIWLSDTLAPQLAAGLKQNGNIFYGPVRVEGIREGPAQYGPEGRYRYRLVYTAIKPLQAEQLSMGQLFDDEGRYNWQLLQLQGGLLVTNNSAVLVEQLGPGGVPADEARQIKLLPGVDDQRLLERLTPAAGGNARYGTVLVEGIWRNGSLTVFSIARP